MILLTPLVLRIADAVVLGTVMSVAGWARWPAASS
jgi:hypothetical protein